MSENYKEIFEGVDENYVKSQLNAIFRTYIVPLATKKKNWLKGGPEVGTHKNKSKQPLVELLAFIFADKSRFEVLYKSLPKPVQEIFYMLTWEGAYEVGFLEERFNVKIIQKNSVVYGRLNAVLNRRYSLFLLENPEEPYYYMNNEKLSELHLYLPTPLRKHFRKYLPPPKGYYLQPLAALKEAEYVYENKDTILRDLPIYWEYLQNSGLKLSKTGLILKSSLKKMQQFCNIEEFFDEGDKNLQFLRTKLIAEFLQKTIPQKMPENSLEQLKEIFKMYGTNRTYSHLNALLFHLQGRKQIGTEFAPEIDVAPQFISLLSDFPVEKWVDIENIIQYALLRDMNLLPVTIRDASYNLYIYPDVDFSWSYSPRTYIDGDFYAEAILLPLMKGVFFLFAAFGLVNIAYNSPENDILRLRGMPYLSVFDGLKYVQLTPLGAYILGKSNEYKTNIRPEQADILLDEDRLILTLHGKDRVARMVLDQIAERIGEHYYKIDYNSFLKGCKTAKDIDQRIKMFKNKISSSLPPIWENFFKSVRARINPLEPCEMMLVYKLKADKELIALFVKDEVLKRNVLKAENHHILIEDFNFPTVKKRLQSYGYLVTKG
ncbi:MAG: hypothetical protein D6814_08755 [Calditrichaeota bacterium]|nr:MAG: hypothetical protein D6814_08755 [Calditrichota bacterium]